MALRLRSLVLKKKEEEVVNIPMDFAPYSNNNMVAMMRRMNYLPRMNLGKTVKKPIVQDLMIPTTTPPFGCWAISPLMMTY